MHKYSQVLKVSMLALVLSFGLSYVYAWTAPTQSPPNGNVSAPINTSAVSQTKSGDIAINNATHFLDTGTVIPETPASGMTGAGAVALNGWPNFADVSANTLRLNGMTSSEVMDSLSAQTGSGGMSMFINFGDTTCPTAAGWTVARTGVVTGLTVGGQYAMSIEGSPSALITTVCMGAARTTGGTAGSIYNGTAFISGGTSAYSCAVCVR